MQCICIVYMYCIVYAMLCVRRPQAMVNYTLPPWWEEHFLNKGSSIYYVIIFGGLGRPLPPYVICNHLGLPPPYVIL